MKKANFNIQKSFFFNVVFYFLLTGCSSAYQTELPNRSNEHIRDTIDNHKASIWQLYLNARKTNPSIEGKIVFEFKILPHGKVRNAKIVSSQLNHNDLEIQLKRYVESIEFGDQNVKTSEIEYMFVFFAE
ncbi:AgmX/PglI C-terminal domain-containing protein [Marinibactrum halimedae]|uniref:AgmX/PglI C-terminal domain-containing protein n=1 Tax=Marinibactrum halimedae TaxID=1444977 RepID=UPI001E51DAF0|nr:AgmX/PglI C-terminal domain-containing protein [Marinibactrum halimedae]MCD9461355.1 AgmX/PglI C-terminal domain-containing protein [Marinibactrum halimedae]